MNKDIKVLLLTSVLWTIVLIVYPFFYSNETGDEILGQGDLIIALVTSVSLGVGLKIHEELFKTLTYVWVIMTSMWILVANVSRVITPKHMEIFDAVYARMFFSLNEWWIALLLTGSLLVTMCYTLKTLNADNFGSKNLDKRRKSILTVISISIPVVWCLILNLRK